MAVSAHLTLAEGKAQPDSLILQPEKSASIGRHRTNQIVLQDEHASRHHAEVYFKDDCWYVRDIGALNRTQVNGKSILGPTPLPSDARIKVGRQRESPHRAVRLARHGGNVAEAARQRLVTDLLRWCVGQKMHSFDHGVGLEQHPAAGHAQIEHRAVVAGADHDTGARGQVAHQAGDEFEFIHEGQRFPVSTSSMTRLTALNNAWVVMGASKLSVAS